MPNFVQPRPDAESDQLVALFAHHGLNGHAARLATLCRAGLDLGDGDFDETDEHVLDHIAGLLRPHASEDAPIIAVRVAHVVVECLRQRFSTVPVDRASRLDAMITKLAKEYDDVTGAIEALFREKDMPTLLKQSGVIGALLARGLVDPARFMDVEEIRNTRKHLAGENWNEAQRESDPRLPEYWSALDPEQTLKACETLLEREPLASLGRLAWGLERCLDLRYPGRSEHLYPHLRPITQLLARSSGRKDSDALLTACTWRFGSLAREQAEELLGDDYQRLRELALAELGRVRSSLRDERAATFLVEQWDYLHSAAFFVLRTDAPNTSSLWGVLRRLLLGLRALPQRGVPLDLRTWDERGLERVPQPWGRLPFEISNLLELLLARELEIDPHLHELRRNLAEFCLDRLKTREKVPNDEVVSPAALVEPDASWRIAYAHAVRELQPRLGDRAHKVLHWSMRRDPDPAVRAEVKKAYDRVRRSHGLPLDASPRRAVFAAYWWLRQAHVLALGDCPDEAGAQRTFRKEMRRQATDQHTK